MRFTEPVKALKEPLFARLYSAQAISLLGDAFTWMGIALLAFEFGGKESSKILAISLTLRVSAFILFGSYAGVIADRINRKTIMLVTNLCRMAIVLSFVFISQVWQLYILIFILNVFNAFFTPAFKACIPQLIVDRDNFAKAISLSNATWQLLGILGPGLAGAMAVVWGTRQIFIFDAFSFVISSFLVFFIPITTLKSDTIKPSASLINIWKGISGGTKLLFSVKPIRFSLLIELSAAIAGAQIIVNTVGHIKGDLLFSDREYGWTMAAFGIGATIGAFTAASADRSKNKVMILTVGALLLACAVSAASFVPLGPFILLWIIAGIGQNFACMPSQILIAENFNREQQGTIYGSHFAWTHLWWACGYIIAGITGTFLHNIDFLTGGIISLLLLTAFSIIRIMNRAK
jgi:MFS transporter, NRE family, putaive nickel resistance protein